MGQTDEETVSGKFQTTLIAAYGRKNFIMKKMKRTLIVIALVVALVSALCTQVFAEIISTSCNLFEGNLHMGYATLWYDTLDEYVMTNDVQALDADSYVEANVTEYFIHYDLAIPDSRSSSSCGTYSTSATVTVRPNLGTVYEGYAEFTIASTSDWLSIGW